MLQKIWTNMSVTDVNKTIDFYQEILGFEFVMGVPMGTEDVVHQYNPDVDLVYCLLKHGDVEMMFQEKENLLETITCLKTDLGGSLTFYFDVDDVTVLRDKLVDKVEIVKDLHDTFYRMKEFYIKDCNGYVLGFAQPLD